MLKIKFSLPFYSWLIIPCVFFNSLTLNLYIFTINIFQCSVSFFSIFSAFVNWVRKEASASHDQLLLIQIFILSTSDHQKQCSNDECVQHSVWQDCSASSVPQQFNWTGDGIMRTRQQSSNLKLLSHCDRILLVSDGNHGHVRELIVITDILMSKMFSSWRYQCVQDGLSWHPRCKIDVFIQIFCMTRYFHAGTISMYKLFSWRHGSAKSVCLPDNSIWK